MQRSGRAGELADRGIGAHAGDPQRLGQLLLAEGELGAGAAGYAVAVVTFALAGVGNGLVLVHERLLLQGVVPDRLMGSLFAVTEAGQCWAFTPGLVAAPVLISVLGTRALFLLGGALVAASRACPLVAAVARRRCAPKRGSDCGSQNL